MHPTKNMNMSAYQTTPPPLGRPRTGNLKQKNRTFRSLFENTGTGTILVEDDMTISMANGGFEKITGMSREAIEDRMKLTDFVHPDDRERLRKYHAARRRGERVPIDYQCRLSGSQTGLRHMAVRAQVISGTRRSVVSFMDITDLVQSKQDLERSEQRLANLLNNLPGMAYRYAADGRFGLEFASEGCFSLTGFQPSRLTGPNGPTYADLIHPEERDQVLASVRHSLDEKKPFQVTYRIQTALGKEKWVWEQGAGIFSQAGEPVAVEGFITDFSGFKEMEQELLEREELLKNENERLRSQADTVCGFGDLVGKSEPMRQVYRLIQKAAQTDAGVIIYGESGTGKELAARRIHDLSPRRNGRFVAVNCGAVPESIFESEFFGYKKGAFSGADKDSQGYLDVADKGTLFLDEVGEISPAGQVKLLRVIDGGGYKPVGGRRERHPDIRIIAATNKDLKKQVKKGDMREDFFFRIHIFPIFMPPLRDKKEDIPLLIDRLLEKSDFRHDPPPSADVLRRLLAYDWPGNVRELQNTLLRYMTTRTLDFITSETAGREPETPEHGFFPQDGDRTLRTTLHDFERRYIRRLLDKHQWHRANVAKILGIDRRTLLRKMQTLGIE